MPVSSALYHSPCGTLLLTESDGCLAECDWVGASSAAAAAAVSPESALLLEAVAQLDAYFRGHLASFDLPVSVDGSDFRRKVLSSLAELPFGSTVSYGEYASMLGCRPSVRAVARALGSNRLSIILPCHRVVGAASIGGYRGGIEAKRYLLRHEGSHPLDIFPPDFVTLQS